MIIDLIEVLNKEEDPDPEPEPDPKEITSDPDLRCPKCNGSFGSGSGTLVLIVLTLLVLYNHTTVQVLYCTVISRHRQDFACHKSSCSS